MRFFNYDWYMLVRLYVKKQMHAVFASIWYSAVACTDLRHFLSEYRMLSNLYLVMWYGSELKCAKNASENVAAISVQKFILEKSIFTSAEISSKFSLRLNGNGGAKTREIGIHYYENCFWFCFVILVYYTSIHFGYDVCIYAFMQTTLSSIIIMINDVSRVLVFIVERVFL